MQTVYAYRDDGLMSPLSRWKPRRIVCTSRPDHSDLPGIEHVVKLGQGDVGTAALISEVVCTGLLAAGGVRVLDARIVNIGLNFARAYSGITPVVAGPYYGSVRLWDVENGPPPSRDFVADLQEVVDIWAFDSWFCNIDRVVDGNILLVPGKGGFKLIAADQSDCFGGSGRIADGSWRRVLADGRPASAVSFLDQAIYNKSGGKAVNSAIDKVRAAFTRIDGVLEQVPECWWNSVPRLNMRELRDALDNRLRRLPIILDVKKWEDLDDATRQGHILF